MSPTRNKNDKHIDDIDTFAPNTLTATSMIARAERECLALTRKLSSFWMPTRRPNVKNAEK